MTDKPAAFYATYSDWKLIRTRKVVQIVLEVGLEQAGAAYDVLGGMPNPGAEIWCGIARLNGKPESETPPAAASDSTPDPRPSPPMPPARVTPSKPENKACQRLGILCNEPAFRKFLEDRRISPRFVNSAESAASAIRDYFGVKSRTEVWEDNPKYIALMADYRAWPTVLRVVPA